MTRILRHLVERPRLALLLTLLALVAGGVATTAIRRETMPRLDLGVVDIRTQRPGASPQDVELSITAPLEHELLEVPGIDRLVSRSMEGLSIVSVRLDPDERDPDRIWADLNKAVERASSRLPRDLPEPPRSTQLSTEAFPVIEIHVTGTCSEDVLRKTSRTLADALLDVPGVGRVSAVGRRGREVHVVLDPRRMERLGVTYDEIEDAIARRNLRSSGSATDGFVADQNVVAVGAFEDPKDVRRVVVRSAGPGNAVRLDDLGDVFLGYEDWQVASRIDGRPSIALAVHKEAGSDGVDTSAAIHAFVERVSPDLPAGVILVPVNDIARFVTGMLGTLLTNAALGLGLVVVTLLVFFDWRLSLWVATGLPVAIGLTLAGMVLLDIPIDMVSLVALILVLGMLVDDAIVTAESIEAQRGRGGGVTASTVRAVVAVKRPVFASSLTTVLAFCPAAFLGGIDSETLWVLPVVVGLALGSSLLDSTFLLPAHLAHRPSRARRGHLMTGLTERYRELLRRRLLPHRGLALASFVVASVAAVVGFGSVLRFNLYPEQDVDAFFIEVELPEGTSFATTTDKVARVEALVSDVVPPIELLHTVTRVGHHDTNIYGDTEGRHPSWALVGVYMRPMAEREISSGSVFEALRARFPELRSEYGFHRLSIRPLDDAPRSGKPLELEVVGGSRRESVADQIARFARTRPGVTEVWTSDIRGKDVISVEFDHDRLSGYGLTVADVSQAIRVAFDGRIVSELETADERIRYRLRLGRPSWSRLELLEHLTIARPDGPPVALRTVARLTVSPGPASIKHYRARPTITVYAEIDREATSVEELNGEVREFIEAEGFLEQEADLWVHFGGELEQQREALGHGTTAAWFALGAVFLVLVLLFDSLTQPILVMLVIPFGLTGVVIGFAIQGFELSLISLIGVVGLTGVLVNDSLVMVSHVNARCTEGEPDLDELAESASDRLRPIIVTSITTMAGLVPTAYGLAGKNPFIAPMAMAMAWGILFGTAVTLLGLPCMLALERDVRRILRRGAGDR